MSDASTERRRPELLASLVVAAGVFAIHAATLHPSIAGTDSAELVVAAYQSGVTSPPSSPLFIVLAKLATLVPLGGVAFRVNVLSALLSAATAGTLHAATRRWSGSQAGAIAAAAAFAFSDAAWSHARVASAAPLNALIVALFLLTAVRFAENGDVRWARFFALLFGLGLSSQSVLVLVATPIAIWFAVTGGSSLRQRREPLRLLALAAAGLLPFASLPAAARGDSLAVWGDPATRTGLVEQLVAGFRGTPPAISSDAATSALAPLVAWSRIIAIESFGVVPLLAIVGAVWLARTDRHRPRFGRAFLVTLALTLVAFVTFAVPPMDPLAGRFWILPSVLVAFAAGAGIAALLARGSSRVASVAVIAAVGLSLTFAARRFPEMRRKANRFVESYGRGLIYPLLPNSILLTRGGESTHAARYAQLALGNRPDVVILDQSSLTTSSGTTRARRLHPDVVFPGERLGASGTGRFTLEQFCSANVTKRPIAVAHDIDVTGATWDESFELWPEGLVSRVVAREAEFDFDDWIARARDALGRLPRPSPEEWRRYSIESPERRSFDEAWLAWNRFGFAALMAAGNDAESPALLVAIEAFDEIAAGHPELPWWAEKNRGLAYLRRSNVDPSFGAKAIEAWKNYLAKAPMDDKERPFIESVVDRAGETIP